MKYKYSRIAIFIQFLIFALADFWLIFLASYLNPDNPRFMSKIVGGFAAIFIFMVSAYGKEMIKKHVMLHNEYVCFNSFRFKGDRKASSVNVRYEDILSFDVKTLPLIGVWAVQINAKNLPEKMTVSFCFCKHKELYRKLCEAVKERNPKVYIDNRLEKKIFQERKI